MTTKELQKRIQMFINDIKWLRLALSKDGEYSICRSDGKPLGLHDIYILSETMARLDKTIEVVNGGLND